MVEVSPRIIKRNKEKRSEFHRAVTHALLLQEWFRSFLPRTVSVAMGVLGPLISDWPTLWRTLRRFKSAGVQFIAGIYFFHVRL
uniref:Uncharacterized protein n=1 Tax=Salix viminalis TaxID=40686 RepID=A0A6N2M5U6_SALVM